MEEKDLSKAFRRIWTTAALVLLVFLPTLTMMFGAFVGLNPLSVVAAVAAAGALEYGLAAYEDWGRKATQIAGVLILAFMAFIFHRGPTTYQALDWLFTPLNLAIIASAVYGVAAGQSKGVREIFAAKGDLGDPSLRGGRAAFIAKRVVLIFLGYVLWTSACRGFHRMADQAAAESKGVTKP
jgi:hypothetical protein